MLRAKRRYRSEGKGIFVEAGEVLRDLTPDMEAWLQRDCPDVWEVVTEKQVRAAKAPDAPPVHKMVEREATVRKTSQTGGEAMTSQNTPGLVRSRRQ